MPLSVTLISHPPSLVLMARIFMTGGVPILWYLMLLIAGQLQQNDVGADHLNQHAKPFYKCSNTQW